METSLSRMKGSAARQDAGLAPKCRILVFVGSTGDADECARLFAKPQKTITYLALAARFVARPKKETAHVLITVMMLNEGWDCPGVDLVVLARTTESEIVFAQQMGRGLRKDAGDPLKELSILDLALNLRRRWKRLSNELRWKRLSDELPDAEVKDMLSSFWMVSNFVGEAIE
ncbi:hypothetical protein T484DRAFT_1770143 [Baffinella frigidus]|nr:hypothetical protein T484DRAFT_1770143 [Cryptophyta sp. CCMP2293]